MRASLWNHCFALALASSDGIMSRMVGQAGVSGAAGCLQRRPREPGEAERRRRRAEGDAVQAVVVEGGSVF